MELNDQVWNKNQSWDQYNTLRGRQQMLAKIMRAPYTIQQMKEEKLAQQKETANEI